MFSSNISSVDVTIIGLFMIATVVFGTWIGRGAKGLDGYLLGGRSLPWFLVLGSIIATETSTVTFLSIPGTLSSPTGDFRFLQLVVGYIIGRLIVVWFLLPKFFQGQPFTAYQVLRNRFGQATSQSASLFFIITRTLSDGLRLYLTAIVLEKALGVSLEFSIIVIGIATIIYTFFGGMKSVVWNDCIQLIIYLGGAIIALVLLIQALSMGEILDYADRHDSFQWLVTDFDLTQAYTIWAGICGGIFLTLATHGTDQLMVQRYLCAKNKKQAGIAIGVSGPLVFAQFALFLFIGLGLACFYSQNEDGARTFHRGDEIFATYIVEELPVGVTGIVLAAVFSAAMSTLSSSLNSSATAVINDLRKKPKSPHESEVPSAGRSVPDTTPLGKASNDNGDSAQRQSRLTLWSRLWTVVFGVAQVGVAIGANQLFQTSDPSGVSSFGNSVITGVLAVAGFVTGIILGIFFIGILTPFHDDRTTRDAAAAGLITMTYIAFCTDIAWTWYAVIGSLTTFLVGIAFHLLHQLDRKSPSNAR